MEHYNLIDRYLTEVHPESKLLLEEVRQIILEVIPDAQQVISYGVPAFKYKNKAVVGFAAFKSHCSFLAFSGSLFSQFKEELANFKKTKSALHLVPSNPLPKELLIKLIKARLGAIDV